MSGGRPSNSQLFTNSLLKISANNDVKISFMMPNGAVSTANFKTIVKTKI